MFEILEIVKIIAPTLIVAGAVYFILKKQHEKELKLIGLLANREHTQTQPAEAGNDKNIDRSIVLPLKLQAFERITIFLERIEPSSLIMRIHMPGMSSKLLHADLLKAIREEYDHNAAQQIYISKNGWSLTQQAKEETIKIINMGLTKLNDDATGMDLSRTIFEMMMTMQQSPSNIALNYIQEEVKSTIDI